MPEGYQRLWVLYGGSVQVIGVVVPRERAPDAAAETRSWRALVSHARLSEAETVRETLDGRRFAVRQVVYPILEDWLAFDTLTAAIDYLDALKQKNIGAGWIEVALDPIGDPD